MAGVRNGNYIWLVIFAVLMAAVSVYYYFRVIQAMYFREGEAQMTAVSGNFRTVLLVTALLVIVLGIYPQLLIDLMYH